MKAVCVTKDRSLQVRDVPAPSAPPSGHMVVEIEAAGINHGDKAFLALPGASVGLPMSQHDIWGVSAAGRVIAIGPDVPEEFAGRKVALYRSLTPSEQIIGVWSERVQIPWTSAVILPEEVSARDYSGSLVNIITPYAFLEEAIAKGHKGILVTAGSSATGLAMAALAQERGVPALFLVRSQASRDELIALGLEHVLVTTSEDFTTEFAQLAAQLQTTAVFDGVGGALITQIAPHLPMNSTVSLYGFLAGTAPISIPSGLFMMKNLTLTRFSNFNTEVVKDTKRLAAAFKDLQRIIANPLFRTKIGRTFSFDQIREAMASESTDGGKAILVPSVAS